MRLLCFLFFLVFSPWASATKVADKPLPEMVQEASDIAIAHVDRYSGRRSDGSAVTAGEFRTGPGSGNTAIAYLRIIEVLKGTALHADMVHPVELWPAWHKRFNLGGPADDKRNVIVFLKQSGGRLMPVFEPEPYRDDHLEQAVRDLLKPGR